MNCQHFLDTVGGFSRVLAIKLYRLHPDDAPAVPILPCLDHEAMLHERIAPHAAAYIEDHSGALHEVVFIPDERRIYVDVVSTMGECTPESHERLLTTLRTAFTNCRIEVHGPSWVRGDVRVANACRAQVALHDVLMGEDLERTSAAINRLQIISTLMEKESRVASWAARTVMTPLLAVAGFLTYEIAGTFVPRLGVNVVSLIRSAIIGVLGAFFLYYGLKAVHLTGMANRAWKRSAEYGLILSERRRLMK